MSVDREKLATYIKTINFFSSLGYEECLFLADKTRQSFKKTGQVILQEGEIPTYIYLLRKGKAICYFLRPGGKKSVLYHIAQDRPFAVETALTESRLSGDLEITEDAQVIAIPVSAIRDLMRTDAAFACQVARYEMDSVLRLTDFVKDLSFGAPARLSRFLFRRALESSIPHEEGICFDLGLRKSMLADYLGITPETLSRIFLQLQNEKIISVDGSRITVSNVRDLVRLSEGF